MDKKYVIVDIHPEDAFSGDKDYLIGKKIKFTGGTHSSLVGDGYVAGVMLLDKYWNIIDGHRLYAYAFMVQSIEDNEAENGKIMRL